MIISPHIQDLNPDLINFECTSNAIDYAKHINVPTEPEFLQALNSPAWAKMQQQTDLSAR